MIRLHTIPAVTAFSICLTQLTAGAAQAQTSGGQAASERPTITVIAPRARQTDRTYTGIPIETLTAQSIVYFDDLNLGTDAGQKELKARVAKAATEACKWLDQVYPLSTPVGPDNCVLDAQKRAQEQIDVAINQAPR